MLRPSKEISPGSGVPASVLVAARLLHKLLLKPFPLLDWIIQLAERICHFQLAHEQLEALDGVRIVLVTARRFVS